MLRPADSVLIEINDKRLVLDHLYLFEGAMAQLNVAISNTNKEASSPKTFRH